MRRVLVLGLVAGLAVALVLGSVVVFVAATISISALKNPLWHVLALLAELLAGIFWLLGTIYVATHLAVLVFRERSASARGRQSESTLPKDAQPRA
jgi:hypothetical protein